MKRFAAAATVLGALTFVLLLRNLDMAQIVALVVSAGWGVLFIVGQEIVAHVLNALGWRFAFEPRQAGTVSFGRLVQLRIAGDAVNYLTPTATVGGEVSRAVMLRARDAVGVEPTSIIVAKIAQTIAQALFVACGVVLVVRAHMHPAGVPALEIAGATIVLLLLLVLAVPRVRRALPPAPRLRAIGRQLADFLRHHRGRGAASIALFFAGYAWGVVEAWWICRCLGLDLSVSTILAIETMSAGVDGVLFMVPAKIGTQEGGKAAIFAALGLSSSAGFAFGLLRHVRELVWAAVGLVICARWWRTFRAGDTRSFRALWSREGKLSS